MEDYKGYFILGVGGSNVPNRTAIQVAGHRSEVRALGYTVVKVKRIEGMGFDGKQGAEQHGPWNCAINGSEWSGSSVMN
jgi:hypothetical protein